MLATDNLKRQIIVCTSVIFLHTIGSNYLYSESNRERLDPKNFIETIYKKINKVASKESNELERISDMLSLFNESVDVLFISRAVLGPSWKTSTRAERRHFSSDFLWYAKILTKLKPSCEFRFFAKVLFFWKQIRVDGSVSNTNFSKNSVAHLEICFK